MTSVKQNRDEFISDYFKRFKEVKNRCFNLSISDKDLIDVAFNGLRSYLKEKLEGFDYYNLNALQLRAMSQVTKFKNSKDAYKPHRSNTHVVEYDSDSSSDEDKEVYTAEFVWPSAAKPSSCASLKPVQKNQKEEMKFTFDVSKYDHIFDELLHLGGLHIFELIVNFIILILMRLMIAMYSVARFNRP